MISCEKLNELIDSTAGTRAGKIASSLKMALNDWPAANLSEPSDLILALNQTIKRKLLFENLRDYMNRLTPEKDAWKMEALSSIIEMFDQADIENEVELETIINRLSGEE